MPEGVLVRPQAGGETSAAFAQGQRQILEAVATGAPLRDTLERIVGLVERESEGVLASILVLEGTKLRHGAAPSLPAPYNAAIDGLEIGDGVGSCGTAAATGRLTIVEDVQAHPYWAPFRELAGGHGLRACWSSPIKGRDGTVLGTFALYYREPRAPTPRDEAIIRDATHLASVAIQHDRLVREETNRRVASAQREQLRSYFLRAPMPIAVLTGPDLVYEVANPLYEAMVDRRGLQGRPVAEVFPELEGQGVIALLQRIRETGQGHRENEMRVWLQRGGATKEMFFSVSIEPLRDVAGNTQGLIVVAADVTELVEARDQLHSLRGQLAQQEKLGALGQLVSGVAHEIRTPLTYLTTNLNLIQLRLDRLRATFTPKQLEAAHMLTDQYIPSAIEAVDRINHLVEDLRAYSKQPTGARDAYDVDRIVAEAVDIFQATHRGRAHVTLRAGAASRAVMDRVQVQQAILNLLQNSMEAKPRDGIIRVETAVSGSTVRITVSDTGAGIPPEVLPRIFDPFYTTKEGGTGLGLSIVKRIMDAHHGRVDVDTTSQGTTFALTLPSGVT